MVRSVPTPVDPELKVALMERNHGVSIEGSVVRCLTCGFSWRVKLTRAGVPQGREWWLCREGLCNLSGQLAKKYLRRLDRGVPLPDGVTVEDCRKAVARAERQRGYVAARGDVAPYDRDAADRVAAMSEAELEQHIRAAVEAADPQDQPAQDNSVLFGDAWYGWQDED